MKRLTLVVSLLALAATPGCFSGMAVFGNMSFSDSGNSYRGPDFPGAIVLDVVTAPVQIAALAGYLLVKGAVDVADAVVSLPEDIRRDRIYHARQDLRRDLSCATNAVYTAFDGDRLTPQAEAFAELLGWSALSFPTNVVEGAVERLRADPRAIPPFAKVLARRELGAAALEDLFPTVLEWHEAWSRDCGRFYLSNPNLPPGVLSRIVADPEMPPDLAGLARNRMRGIPPGEAAAPPSADDLAAALARDPVLALKDPVFWNPGNEAAMDAVGRLLADPGVRIPEPVLYFFARNVLEDVRWWHVPFLDRLFERPEFAPETLEQFVRELVARPTNNLDNVLRSVLVNPSTPDKIVAELANGPDDGPWTRTWEFRAFASRAREERGRRAAADLARRLRERPETLPDAISAVLARDGGAGVHPVWQVLGDPGVAFPEEALVAAAERMRGYEGVVSIVRGIPLLARPELGPESLERLRPVVLEWSRIPSAYLVPYFEHPAMTPELAYGLAVDPELGETTRRRFQNFDASRNRENTWRGRPEQTQESLVAEARADPSILLRDFRFWVLPSGKDVTGRWSVLAAVLAQPDIEIPERVLVLLGGCVCTEGFYYTGRLRHLFARPEFKPETLASFARRYPGKKELDDFMPDLLRNPKTPPEEIRRIAESTGAVDPDVRRIAADVLAALHAESAESESHAESAEPAE